MMEADEVSVLILAPHGRGLDQAPAEQRQAGFLVEDRDDDRDHVRTFVDGRGAAVRASRTSAVRLAISTPFETWRSCG